MTEEDIASKEACRILREYHIGLDHPNIDAYDDTYVINNYPFEWGLFMEGWKSKNESLKETLKNILELLNRQSEYVDTPTGKEYIRRMIYDVIPELNPY